MRGSIRSSTTTTSTGDSSASNLPDNLTGRLLDESVRRLKIEYDVYFGGGSKKPPADTEWRVKSLMQKYSDNAKLNYAQRFRYNSITQKYALFNNLWQQKLRVKEEGYRRPQDARLPEGDDPRLR